MTDDGLADLMVRYLIPLEDCVSFNYWKGDFPSWTRMGYVPKKLKILY